MDLTKRRRKNAKWMEQDQDHVHWKALILTMLQHILPLRDRKHFKLKTVMACFKILANHLLQGNEENHEKI
jgi:hypothetical protein